MGITTRSKANQNQPVMATPPTTPKHQPPVKLVLSPPLRSTPPTILNSLSTNPVQAFQFRASTLSKIYSNFLIYLESIELKRSHKPLTSSDLDQLAQNILKADWLSNSFWALLRDLLGHIRSLYLNGKDTKSALVFGYSAVKIVVRCPYCDDYHEHKRVADAGIGVPVVYPAGCGASGKYRVVFPGDVDQLTGTAGKVAIGLQVHRSGAYWMTVTDDMPNLENHFVIKFRPKKPLPTVTKTVVAKSETKIDIKVDLKEEKPDGEAQERLMYEAFQRLDIIEDKSYDPIPITPPKHQAMIRQLQQMAKVCGEKLNNLDQIVGQYSKPEYTVISERWKEKVVQRDTRNKVERETDWQMCTVKEAEKTRLLGLVESDGFRTICSCIRGPNYPDISVVSGLVERERLESHLQLNNKQLRLLVEELAKEIGHKFPKEIPSSASVIWKRELERKNLSASASEHWHACHAEKKMLVRFLIMHTTWMPQTFSHNIFKYRSLLGKEAGMRSAVCLARHTKFWVSFDICEDCKKFIAGVEKKFGLHLSFQKMSPPPVSKKQPQDNKVVKTKAGETNLTLSDTKKESIETGEQNKGSEESKTGESKDEGTRIEEELESGILEKVKQLSIEEEKAAESDGSLSDTQESFVSAASKLET